MALKRILLGTNTDPIIKNAAGAKIKKIQCRTIGSNMQPKQMLSQPDMRTVVLFVLERRMISKVANRAIMEELR